MLPTLKRGMSSNNVKIARYLTGYNSPGKASSSFTPQFENFMKNWQKEHELKIDGVIGEETWTAIAENAPEANSKNKVAIYALQLALGISANGSLTSITKSKLKIFQQAAGVPADGICGKETWLQLLALKPVVHKHTVCFMQTDPKWANKPYTVTGAKSQNYYNSACGPTSAASVVYSLKDKSVDPTTLGELAIKSGCRRKTGGTDSKFFSIVAKQYGFSRMIETTNVKLFKHCLDSGGYVICAFKPKSWWTSCGHYSPAWAYDDKYYYVDNTYSKIKVKRKLSYLTKDCRAFFCFYP